MDIFERQSEESEDDVGLIRKNNEDKEIGKLKKIKG